MPPPPPSDMAMAMPQPLHEAEGTVPQKYAEVDGYAAGQKFPSEVAGGGIATKAYEIDSTNYVAELPGAHDGPRNP